MEQVPKEVIDIVLMWGLWTIVYVCLPLYGLTVLLLGWSIIGSMLPAKVKGMYLVVLAAFLWFPPAIFKIDEAIRREESQVTLLQLGNK